MEGGSSDNIDRYISAETYIQHNAEVADGVEGFKAVASIEPRSLVYDEIVLAVGQGNFVATLCKARWEGAPYAQVDLFRIEDGLFVEHWDNAEPVPPEDEWVNSGKF
jgi:predicted SnoaL-like aldol condensation-catalyzing enzyme